MIGGGVSFYDFFATYISDSIRTFSTLILSLFSTILSPIHSSCSYMLLYVSSYPLDHIQYVCSDSIHSDLITLIWYDSILSNPIQSNIILSLIFYPLNLLCYYSLYFDHSNTIQYACVLALTCSAFSTLLFWTSNFFSNNLTLGSI